MDKVTSDQRSFVESQVSFIENAAAHIYNQIGQLRVGLNDPGFSQEQYLQLVRIFQNEAALIETALDTIQERIEAK